MKHQLSLIAVAAILSACGGGSGDTTSAAGSGAQLPSAQTAAGVAVGMQKYVGSWTSACLAEGAQSARMTITINAPSGDTSNGMISGTGYEYTACGGRSATTSMSMTLKYVVSGQNGTDTIEVTQSGSTGPETFILSADGKTLSINDGVETITFTRQ